MGAFTGGYVVFLGLMAAAWLVMVWTWIGTVRFFGRNLRPGESQYNPLTGLKCWGRFVSRNGFGADAEPDRRRLARQWLVAAGLFAMAVALFVALDLARPGGPA